MDIETNRGSRQEGLAPMEKLKAAHCFVIGCGAVGRATALMLAAMGTGKMTLFDHDTVEDVNLAPQMYWESALGKNKAIVTGEDCAELNSKLEIEPVGGIFTADCAFMLQDAYVFFCVDNIETRKILHDAARGRAKWIVDARVLGEEHRVLSEDAPPAEGGKYEQTLFSREEAVAGTCATKMVVYGAKSAAAHMVHLFARRLRELHQPFTDKVLSLSTGMWIDLEAPSKPKRQRRRTSS